MSDPGYTDNNLLAPEDPGYAYGSVLPLKWQADAQGKRVPGGQISLASRNPKTPATYSGTLNASQQRALDLINNSGQAAGWEAGGPDVYHRRLLSNYQGTLENTPEKYISGGIAGLGMKIQDLKSIDPSKLVGPPQTSNYVIFDPSNIRIIGRNGEELQQQAVDHDPWVGARAP